MFILNLSLSVFEISLLCFMAIIVGITIHFTYTSRRNLKSSGEKEEMNKFREEWKLRYFNDMETKDKEMAALKEQLEESEENTNIYSIEAEEMRKENKKLLAEMNSIPKAGQAETEKGDDKKLIEEWVLRYSGDMELKNKELASLKDQLAEAEEIRRENRKLLDEMSSMSKVVQAPEKGNEDENKLTEEWKLRYFNDMELKNKELASLKEHLTEAEEIRRENKRLLAEMNNMSKLSQAPEKEKPDYMEQLRLAQTSLMDHNDKINQLLKNIDAFKEKEEKQREIMKRNDELFSEITELQVRLADKDKEISSIRKKEILTKEMTSMLDNAYSEFNVLQGKMQKLELQANSSKLITLEYEDLKENSHRMTRDFEEQKTKLTSLIADHQQLQAQLMETDEKLRESNFQRQQLQKKVAYLEDLNSDLQAVSDANKKLEGQLKRIGELESMLNMAAEEREQMIRRVEK